MKNIFYFSRKERKSLCIISSMLLIILGGFWIYDFYQANSNEDYSTVDSSTEVNRFLSTVNSSKDVNKRNKDTLKFAPKPFDPNTCDSMTLLRFGLKAWQVRIFLKYRKAGAKFYDKNDLLKVYSFSREDVERMIPYAHFPINERNLRKIEQEKNKNKRDSVYKALIASYPEKLKEGEWVDLNKADTSDLKKIPGIGSYYAAKINRYGARLGGYISVDQLKEL